MFSPVIFILRREFCDGYADRFSNDRSSDDQRNVHVDAYAHCRAHCYSNINLIHR